jgi:hypothetical protein
MGIDLYQSRANKLDRSIYYKREYVDNMKLIKGAVAQGIFYSTDKVAYSEQTMAVGNMKKTMKLITIETTDNINDLEVDDFVLYGGDGEIYIVDNIVAEDFNPAKEFSNRPSFRKEIRLRR